MLFIIMLLLLMLLLSLLFRSNLDGRLLGNSSILIFIVIAADAGVYDDSVERRQEKEAENLNREKGLHGGYYLFLYCC